MSQQIFPLSDRVLVRPNTPPKMSPGGMIFLPEISQTKAQIDRGTVIAVGPGKCLPDGREPRPINSQIKPGVTILFPTYSGQHVEIDGETLYLISEDGIHGILA